MNDRSRFVTHLGMHDSTRRVAQLRRDRISAANRYTVAAEVRSERGRRRLIGRPNRARHRSHRQQIADGHNQSCLIRQTHTALRSKAYRTGIRGPAGRLARSVYDARGVWESFHDASRRRKTCAVPRMSTEQARRTADRLEIARRRRSNPTMRADDLDFILPPELVAQSPTADRSAARLLHYRRTDASIAHRHFADLPSLLRNDDLIVFNNARVTPARFTLRKKTGGRIDALYVATLSPNRWRVMLKNLGPVDPTRRLAFDAEPSIGLQVIEPLGGGEYAAELSTDEPADAILARVGRMPLPPYIRRERDHDERDAADAERYQTVYAAASGSIAAPTAGLHFTPALLDQIRERAIETAFVTLHVGLGTFKPVTADHLDDHAMHVERYAIDPAAAEAINAADAAGRRVVAVGTTAARVVESQPPDRPIEPHVGETGIFIRPPYRWRRVGALLTNFHLPRSTLIALVAAWVGLDEQRRIYAEAIAQHYRFFSYGDGSFLE